MARRPVAKRLLERWRYGLRKRRSSYFPAGAASINRARLYALLCAPGADGVR